MQPTLSSAAVIARTCGGLLLTLRLAVGCGGDASEPAGDSGPAKPVVDSSPGSSAQEGSNPAGEDAGGLGSGPGASASDGSGQATLDGGAPSDAAVAVLDAPLSPGADASGNAPDEPEASVDAAQSADSSTAPSADGGAPYSPCPAKPSPCVIMPVGDSITEGYRSTDHGGYRSELFHLALVDKKNITFVGSAPPFGPNTVDNVPFPKNNDGHGGYRIDQIQTLILASLTANKPDVVTLMIGTNDVNENFDLPNAPTRLGTLMDTIVGQDPHRLLLVAEIIPTAMDSINTRVQAYNGAIPALVKARADAGKHVALVDMYTPFVNTANYKTVLMRGGTFDYLHPLEAGYQLMGQVWYSAVKPLLP